MTVEYVRYYDTAATACGCAMTPNERELAFLDLGLSVFPGDRDRDLESVRSTVAARLHLAGGRVHVTCMQCSGTWLERIDGRRPELMSGAESWAERAAS
jgi:hypothetical protein